MASVKQCKDDITARWGSWEGQQAFAPPYRPIKKRNDIYEHGHVECVNVSVSITAMCLTPFQHFNVFVHNYL